MTVKMTLTPSQLPQPLLNTILAAVEPFSGARAAAEKAISDASSAPIRVSDTHPDEVAGMQALGWQIAPT